MNPIQPEPFDPLSFHLNNTIPTDRVALVTGGASRMGAVVVQALAYELDVLRVQLAKRLVGRPQGPDDVLVIAHVAVCKEVSPAQDKVVQGAEREDV